MLRAVRNQAILSGIDSEQILLPALYDSVLPAKLARDEASIADLMAKLK